MQQLNSKNYSHVEVLLRNETEVFKMPVAQGMQLMQWLTRENRGSHVRITSIDGEVRTVLANGILDTQLVEKRKELKDYA